MSERDAALDGLRHHSADGLYDTCPQIKEVLVELEAEAVDLGEVHEVVDQAEDHATLVVHVPEGRQDHHEAAPQLFYDVSLLQRVAGLPEIVIGHLRGGLGCELAEVLDRRRLALLVLEQRVVHRLLVRSLPEWLDCIGLQRFDQVLVAVDLPVFVLNRLDRHLPLDAEATKVKLRPVRV